MKKNDVFLFILWFLIFFVLIFLVNITFFSNNDKNDYEETIKDYESYNDINTNSSLNTAKVVDDDFTSIEKKTKPNSEVKKRYNEILASYKASVAKKEIEIDKNENIDFYFEPTSLENLLLKNSKITNINKFTNSNIFYDKLNLKLNFFEKVGTSRGNYKDKTIRIYGANNLSQNEIFSVFVHELGHYFDIDFFEGIYDQSDDFYTISWKETKILKGGQSINDFVSGYAMTNKYEDFAESFIYYIIHNGDFLEKSKKSDYLKNKYDFFSNNLFISGEFKNTNFTDGKLASYYRDVTKIDYFLENLLNYLQKGI